MQKIVLKEGHKRCDTLATTGEEGTKTEEILVDSAVAVMDSSPGGVLEQGEDGPAIKKHRKEKKDKKHKHKHKTSHKKRKSDKSNNVLEGAEKVADVGDGKGHAAKDVHEVMDMDNGKAAGYDSSPESGEIPVDVAVDEDMAEKKVQEGDSGEAGATAEPGVPSADAVVEAEMAKDVHEAKCVHGNAGTSCFVENEKTIVPAIFPTLIGI